jgi:NADP-dependent 3-hydroxy acid dehydrogenase YdfG
MKTLDDKVVVITGAGSGIGRALALDLARRGSLLALSDVDETGLAETVARAKKAGATQVRSDRLDVADRDAFARYALDVVQEFGRVNVVINNAGVALAGDLVDLEYADIDWVVGVNLWGVVHGTKAFLPHLIASGDGHVVNVSSLNGYFAQPTLSAYCASKFAVRGFTEALRTEMIAAGHPVQVTVVHPGGVATNIATASVTEAREQGIELSAEQVARSRTYNEKLLRMPAEQAARIIVDGVEAGRPRVRVGSDAKLIDRLVRLLPARYPVLSAWYDRRLFGRPAS